MRPERRAGVCPVRSRPPIAAPPEVYPGGASAASPPLGIPLREGRRPVPNDRATVALPLGESLPRASRREVGGGVYGGRNVAGSGLVATANDPSPSFRPKRSEWRNPAGDGGRPSAGACSVDGAPARFLPFDFAQGRLLRPGPGGRGSGRNDGKGGEGFGWRFLRRGLPREGGSGGFSAKRGAPCPGQENGPTFCFSGQFAGNG